MTFAAFVFKYRTEIAYALIASIVCFMIWWFGFHIPKVNEQRRQEIISLNNQLAARDAAINMLGDIHIQHAQIERDYEEKLRKLRNSKKPSIDGIFVTGGLLSEMFKADTATDTTAANNEAGNVRP